MGTPATYRRLRESGFTLFESMVALLVLMALGTMVVFGVGYAMHVQEESKFTSESAVLASTINSAIADCIHYKGANPLDDGDKAITLHNKRIYDAVLDVDADDHIVVNGQLHNADGSTSAVSEQLISAGAYDYLKVSSPSLVDGRVTYIITSSHNSNLVHSVDVRYTSVIN